MSVNKISSLLQNIGLTKKIFLAQICIILVIVPMLIAFYWGYRNIEKSFLNITEHTVVRIQTLLSMKNTTLSISNEVEQFSNINLSSPNANEQTVNIKNKILADMEALKYLSVQFAKHPTNMGSNEDDSTNIGQLNNFESDILLNTVAISTMKEKGVDINTIKLHVVTLEKLVMTYQKFINSLTNKEFTVLLSEKQQLQKSRNYMLGFLALSILIALLTAVFTNWWLSYFIAKPIVKLEQNAAKIAGGEYVTIQQKGNDEIGQLAKSLSIMVKNIMIANEKLVTSARVIGMADVANNVLHNVGNALNSINVGMELLKEKLTADKIGNVSKVADLLKAHVKDATNFFSTEQGQLVPKYLDDLGDNLQQTQQAMLDELSNIFVHIEHIKSIITLEQELTVRCGMVESTTIQNLVEDSLNIAISQHTRSVLNIEKNYQFNDEISIDKVKTEQILINLLKNAYESLSELTQPTKTIQINTFAKDDKEICIEIRDNGGGIPPENLQRIFSGGFTSKKTGHGFGLHFSALAAQEMGGTLTVQSEGINKGACFKITLPLTKGKTSHE